MTEETPVGRDEIEHTPDEKPMVEVRNISKIYNPDSDSPTCALEDISFDVEEGQFVSIIGPSGCGKSTLLLLVAGLEEATSGRITVDGQPVSEPLPGLISVVFQEFTLFPWKTAIENVEFPLALGDVGKGTRRERASELLDLVGLEGYEEHYPRELSGGMKQRVAIARSFIQDPQLLLMDEPFGALDEQTRRAMGTELLRIWRNTDKTVIFITHDIAEAVFLSDQVIVLNTSGKIAESVAVDLPRPRGEDTREMGRFGEIENQLWRVIKADSNMLVE